MISALIPLLVLALVLYLIFIVCGWFVTGRPLQIIGLLLALLFLVYALRALHLPVP